MDKKVKVPAEDSDITIELPDGKEFVLQYRVEGPSLDILLPSPMNVYNWEGSEMKPAKIVDNHKEVHLADQLCIPLEEEGKDICSICDTVQEYGTMADINPDEFELVCRKCRPDRYNKKGEPKYNE